MKMRFSVLVLFVVVLSSLAVGCGCTSQVDPGEVGVAVEWGQVHDWIYPPGFHWTPMFGMHVETMSTRTQAYEMGNSGTPDAQGGVESTVERGAAVEVLARDQLAVTLSCTVQYHLAPAFAPQVFSAYGSAYADTIIHPIVRTAVRDAASEFTAVNLIDQRADLQHRMEFLVLARVEDALRSRSISPGAVIVENILLQAIDLPASLDQSIAAVQQQRQETAQRQQQLLTAQAESERAQTEARDVAQQAIIRAQGEADALRIRAQGEADAARLQTASLSPAVLEARRIDAFRAVVSSTTTRTIFVPTSAAQQIRVVLPTDSQSQ